MTLMEQKFVSNEEAIFLSNNAFRERWLEEKEIKDAMAQRDRYYRELSDFMSCYCDACLALRGAKACECGSQCSFQATEHLRRLGYRRMSETVSEAFEELTRRLKENVTGYNVDFFTEVKCYMMQIENDYIKRCYPVSSKKEV